MSLASVIMRTVTNRSAKEFEEASRNPVAVQTELLQGMMQRNADTAYGKRHGFASIRSFEDYGRQAPVVTYEDLREDMNKVVRGEKNIFTADDPVMFAQTSGTTGDPKYIPITPTCRAGAHKHPMRTWLAHAQEAHPDIFAARVVSLVSPAVEGHAPSGLPFGSTSGHMYRNMPWIIRRVYSIPYDVFEIHDYQAKYYVIMRLALEHDVRFLCTANPSSVLKMCEKANEFADDIIKDVLDGAVSDAVEIDRRIRDVLAGVIRPNPRRAKLLEDARERRSGTLKPADYWPNLSLIGCWKGGTVGHYLEKFGEWFDPDGEREIPVRDWGYLSSEARGSIPLSDEGSQGVLTITTNVFEFVEVEELESRPDDPASWRCLNVGDIEDGKEYYIFPTTTGGLYRYDINDVVQVVGHYNDTPQIIFLRKGRGMTNLTGEKVSVNQVIGAYEHASKKTGAVPAHFKAEADIETSRYVFRIEFATAAEPETERAFLVALDEHLKVVNIEYKAKRDSLRLGDPVLHVMREGWYERGRREQVEGGKRAFQAKTQLLSPDKLKTMEIAPELERKVEMSE